MPDTSSFIITAVLGAIIGEFEKISPDTSGLDNGLWC